MKKRRLLTGGAAALAMVFLLTDSKTALSGASEGLSLCLKTAIPSLFPFLFLSSVLVSSLYGSESGLFTYVGRSMGIPKGSESLVIPALLGGYPVGAQNVAMAYANNMLSKENAQRLLCFCSNVGPSFIFGILTQKFTERRTVWLIWMVQLFSIFTASRFFPRQEQQTTSNCNPQAGSSALETTLSAMAKICGWIVLFRIIIAFLENFFSGMIPNFAKPVIYGTLELTNGCCLLDRIGNEKIRFVVCSALLSFGGLCVVGQTASVCGQLKLRYYLLGKMIQAATSVFLATAICVNAWYLIPLWLLAVGCLPVKRKKSSGNSKAIVV